MFGETGLTAHLYLLMAGLLILFFFVMYAFVVDHKFALTDEWIDAFKRANISSQDRDRITHDGGGWYYDGKSLCVGYGDYNDRCPKSEGVCAGPKGKTFGTREEQAVAISAAITAGGTHPECPLIYPSA
jgi:hypothetical protein